MCIPSDFFAWTGDGAKVYARYFSHVFVYGKDVLLGMGGNTMNSDSKSFNPFQVIRFNTAGGRSGGPSPTVKAFSAKSSALSSLSSQL